MQDLAYQFGCAVGYSDHTLGWEADIAAVALGACVIEKHFTLDKTLEGPDHKASLDPAELAAMVRAVRNTEQALGDGRKHVTSSEAKNKAIARKSIVARRGHRRGRGVHGGKPHHQASGRRRFAHALARGAGPNGQSARSARTRRSSCERKRGLRRRGAEAFIS